MSAVGYKDSQALNCDKTMRLSILIGFIFASFAIPEESTSGATLKSEVDASLKRLGEHSPELAGELQKLAENSPRALALLDRYFASDKVRPAEHPMTPEALDPLWKWAGLPAAAYEASGDFDQMLRQYPAIVESARLLGSMKNEDGKPVLLSAVSSGSRFDDAGHFEPAEEIGPVITIDVTSGEASGYLETDSQDFEIRTVQGKDFLVFKEILDKHYPSATSEKQTAVYSVTQNGGFRLVENKAESTQAPIKAQSTQPPLPAAPSIQEDSTHATSFPYPQAVSGVVAPTPSALRSGNSVSLAVAGVIAVCFTLVWIAVKRRKI